ICTERANRLDGPVDKAPAEQRVQVLRGCGLHSRAEAGRHDDCCEVVSGHQSWGARIRTWDRGTKTRCLTTWLRPTICRSKCRNESHSTAAAPAKPPRPRRSAPQAAPQHLATPHHLSVEVSQRITLDGGRLTSGELKCAGSPRRDTRGR